MKYLLFLLALFIGIIQSNAQTYVSGGIYANTTWTKAASPYIVTDTVVVFPGVTLTIEPGVTMKFVDTSRLEIRQAKIIAIGTVTDSIIFTSNNPILKPGNWGGIVINLGEKSDTMHFSFCSIQSANFGISSLNGSQCKTLIKNSNFVSNVFGIYNYSNELYIIDSSSFSYNTEYAIFNYISHDFNILNCTLKKNIRAILNDGFAWVINSTIDSNDVGFLEFNGLIENCDITNNREGFYMGAYHSFYKMKNCRINNNYELGIIINNTDTIINCEIRNNKIGILGCGAYTYISNNIIENNEYGVLVTCYTNSLQLKCNKICYNTNYDIKYQGGFTSNISFPNNYFCTPDSASTRPKIFDGYVDVKYGIVNYMPLDTSCYKTLGVKEFKQHQQTTTKLYPNPFSHTATLAFENPQNSNHQLSIFNTMGQLVMSIENIKGNKVLIDRKELQTGLYFYQLRNEESVVGSGKMMIE